MGTAVTWHDDRRPYPETRFVTVGIINNRLCVIAWCIRNDAMRIISLRKANKREVSNYGKD
ncbi:MAG: BrnT family toxin [Planktomarina sp.]